ncbi:MAG: helix-turn-helix transcriptional regulator [Bacteroidia bacterium]|nr:helix-turn-helix transcriptional regulator [Bacteroidia bacterium]
MEKFGSFISNLRMSRGITLREFCRRTGLDPSNWSKVERSVLPPPKSKHSIVEILETLGFAKGSEEYNTAMDLSILESIPEDFQEERALLMELPVFFRTVRGEKPTEDDLLKLVDYLRKER